MIELPDLGDADGAMWTALLDIAARTHDWTLIGGQMVLLHGLDTHGSHRGSARTWTSS